MKQEVISTFGGRQYFSSGWNSSRLRAVSLLLENPWGRTQRRTLQKRGLWACERHMRSRTFTYALTLTCFAFFQTDSSKRETARSLKFVMFLRQICTKFQSPCWLNFTLVSKSFLLIRCTGNVKHLTIAYFTERERIECYFLCWLNIVFTSSALLLC